MVVLISVWERWFLYFARQKSSIITAQFWNPVDLECLAFIMHIVDSYDLMLSNKCCMVVLNDIGIVQWANTPVLIDSRNFADYAARAIYCLVFESTQKICVKSFCHSYFWRICRIVDQHTAQKMRTFFWLEEFWQQLMSTCTHLS